MPGWVKTMVREPSFREIAADGVVHAVGLLAAIVGAIVMIAIIAVGSGPIELVTVSIYVTGLLAMLGFSAAYNLARTSRHRELLRRFDQGAIFIMIAGTYTPFTVLGLEGAWEISLISVVWTIALLGFILKLFVPRRFEAMSLPIYLALGWTGVVATGPFVDAFDPRILALLAVGGVLYSIGTIFHIWRRLLYQNAIWHGFVVTAASVHYSALLDLVISG